MSGLALSLVPRPSPRPRSGRLALVEGAGRQSREMEHRRKEGGTCLGTRPLHPPSPLTLPHLSGQRSCSPGERGSRQGTPTHLESSREVGWPARPHGQLQPHRGVVQGLAPPNELAHFRVEATAGPGAHLGDHLPCAAASTRGPPVPMEVGILPPQGSLWGLLLKLLGSWQ